MKIFSISITWQFVRSIFIFGTLFSALIHIFKIIFLPEPENYPRQIATGCWQPMTRLSTTIKEKFAHANINASILGIISSTSETVPKFGKENRKHLNHKLRFRTHRLRKPCIYLHLDSVTRNNEKLVVYIVSSHIWKHRQLETELIFCQTISQSYYWVTLKSSLPVRSKSKRSKDTSDRIDSGWPTVWSTWPSSNLKLHFQWETVTTLIWCAKRRKNWRWFTSSPIFWLPTHRTYNNFD